MSQPKTTVVFLTRLDDAIVSRIQRGLGTLPVELRWPAEDASREALLALASQADVLVGWRSDPELLARAERLKLFINPGAGISQHLDHFRALPASRGVVLANGHGNAYSVAQLATAMTLGLANRVIPHHQAMRTGRQADPEARTLYFQDITIGFLGYGAINRWVHTFLQGFDVSFCACRREWGPAADPSETALARYTPETMDAFFTQADVVICALPDTAATIGMVSANELSQLGPAGLLVNVGRGSAIVQEDLYHALQQKTIAGAALDVWWPEDGAGEKGSPPYRFPFHELDNIMFSPHRGADSGGDLGRWDEVATNIRRVHEGKTDYINVVNLSYGY